jgi:hypothetical protein
MMPLAEKQQQLHICLCNQGEDPTEEEKIYEMVVSQMHRVPILYNESFRITTEQIKPSLGNIVINLMKCILREIGLELFQRVVLELRLRAPPKP